MVLLEEFLEIFALRAFLAVVVHYRQIRITGIIRRWALADGHSKHPHNGRRTPATERTKDPFVYRAIDVWVKKLLRTREYSILPLLIHKSNTRKQTAQTERSCPKVNTLAIKPIWESGARNTRAKNPHMHPVPKRRVAGRPEALKAA